jgi:hypothetical protein
MAAFFAAMAAFPIFLEPVILLGSLVYFKFLLAADAYDFKKKHGGALPPHLLTLYISNSSTNKLKLSNQTACIDQAPFYCFNLGTTCQGDSYADQTD